MTASVKPKIRLIDPDEVSPEVTQENTVEESPSVNAWIIDGLPSKGLFYNNSLTGRPLTVKEVKLLTTITAGNIDRIIDTIISSVISGVPTDSILSDDKIYILYWLRAQTFINDGFRINYECPMCGKLDTYHFSVNNINQNFIDDNFKLEFTNPLDGAKITFSPRTIGDEKKVNYFIEHMKTVDLDIDILNVAIELKTINGVQVRLEDSYNYLTSNAQNFSVILSNMTLASCGIANEFTVTCNNCQEAGLIPISFQSSFMLPAYSA